MGKRYLLLALIAVVMGGLIFAAGCGGGGGAETTENQQAEQQNGEDGGSSEQPPPPPTSDATGGAQQEQFPQAFEPTASTPEYFKDLLEQNRPLLVEFYDPDVPVSGEMSKELTPVKNRYQGQTNFLFLNVNEEDTGTAVLLEELDVKTPPYIVIFDRTGAITWRHSGYVDQKVIEQELFKSLKR